MFHTFVRLLSVICAFELVSARSQKPLTVILDSRWSHTPLHLESSEFFAEESNDAFWKFVTDLQTLDLQAFNQASQKTQYESILELAGRQLSPASVSLLKISLALRAHSPAVETFQQIARDKQLPPECEFVLEFSGDRFSCDLNQLDGLLEDSSADKAPDVYQIDHDFGANRDKSVVILYGDMARHGFSKYHNALLKRHTDGKLRYVLRHYTPKPLKKAVRLGGYGVELAIKSTEYKSQDDTKYAEESPETHQDIHHVASDSVFDIQSIMDDELTNLKESEMASLSLQTAQKILKAPVDQQLRLFRDLSQNFPSVARSLSTVKMSDELRKDIERNKKYFQGYLNLESSDTALFINGLYYDMEVTDAFVLLDSIKQETRLLEGLHNAGVDQETIPKLMKLDLTSKSAVYGVDVRDTAVMYINDIETDKEYRSWPSSLQDMLRPTYPGMLRSVRRNMYHLTIVGDPANPECRDMFKFAESFFIHRAPVRVGVVFAVNPSKEATGFSDGGIALLNAFNFISQDKTPYEGLSFITEVYAASGESYVAAEKVQEMFKTKYPSEDLEMIFGSDSDYDTGRVLAWDFINRTGIGSPPVAMLNGVLLKKENLKGDMFEEGVLTEIMKQTPKIQRAIYRGDLADDDVVIDYLMIQDNIMPRLNERILNPSENSVYIDMTGRVIPDLQDTSVGELSSADLGASFASSLNYLQVKNDDSKPMSLWMVADLESHRGRTMLQSALEHLANSGESRLAIIYNNQNVVGQSLTRIVHTAITSMAPQEARLFLAKVLRNYEKIESGQMTVDELVVGGAKLMLVEEEDLMKKIMLHLAFTRTFNIAPGDRALFSNGKLIGPLNKDEEFNAEDFGLLEKYSMAQYGDKVKGLMKDSDLVMKATAVLQRFVQVKTRHDIKYATDKNGVINVPAANEDQAAHEIVAVVDPVSRGAQKLSQVLILLQGVVNANVKVFLNSAEGHKELPLKTYYRFVGDSEPQFTSNGDLTNGPMALFVGLPSKPLLTLAMATPENWLIGAVLSIYDLDNIKMSDVESRVAAEFELEHLLVEGHCFEMSSGSPPRGLEFTLGTPANPVIYDTIVMANLGYFQMKANPGTWYLRIREGRSTELYDVATTENTEKTGQDLSVVVTNFRSKVLKIRVQKKPGKENEELLVDNDEPEDGIWNSITSSISGKKDKPEDSEDDVLNIFSVATGHLYERLLRIMMLSVLKNTNQRVKFWFLKNYLSPSMKDILPYYAKQYGFEYQLVEYKWPRWLNQQTEKQRIIWGYKILFLDVLFPLSVKKIIFVDADQIVRADLKELRELDLGGAPYGYTPFCDSREDMEGFRFWKRGYWASHMGHRRYHISALYVVDLKKFRRIAAGDRLRGQYQGLSQDPNSLSNLDQDLPNNMIHQVAIKSLPQEWLWCETWCDDGSKKNAKTIDLCNNPKTKEPKLVAAARIVPEWTSYDDEVKKMLQKFEEEKKNLSGGDSKDTVEFVEEIKIKKDDVGDSPDVREPHTVDHSEL